MADLATLYCQHCGEEYGLEPCGQCRQLRCPCESVVDCNHVPLEKREVVFHGGKLRRKKSERTGVFGIVSRLWRGKT